MGIAAGVLEDRRRLQLQPLCLEHRSRDSVGCVKPWHVVALSTQQDQHKQPGPGWAPAQPGNKEAPLQRRQRRGRGRGPCHGKRAVLREPWEQLCSWKAPARAGD